MSYCRWSSDDFQCDVYVFGSDTGFETYVARGRYVGVVKVDCVSVAIGLAATERSRMPLIVRV